MTDTDKTIAECERLADSLIANNAGSQPCDCVEILNGHYISRCDCGNYDDCGDIAAWCSRKNHEKYSIPAAAYLRALPALLRLLNHPCGVCDGSGVAGVHERAQGEFEAEQCQACYEREQALAALPEPECERISDLMDMGRERDALKAALARAPHWANIGAVEYRNWYVEYRNWHDETRELLSGAKASEMLK